MREVGIRLFEPIFNPLAWNMERMMVRVTQFVGHVSTSTFLRKRNSMTSNGSCRPQRRASVPLHGSPETCYQLVAQDQAEDAELVVADHAELAAPPTVVPAS